VVPVKGSGISWSRPLHRLPWLMASRYARRYRVAVNAPRDDVGSAADAPPRVEVRRSRRRTRTVSAYRDGDAVVVLIPARLSASEEQEWVARMVAKVGRAERRRRPDDDALVARASQLSARYLDGRARPASVRWVTNQNSRWGSCTPLDGSIRLSTRLQGMPAYVVDYVLLHELTHLIVAGHGEDFWDRVNQFDLAERARGFLEGVSSVRGRAAQT
jgi:predicted metal-dependent hydrolase